MSSKNSSLTSNVGFCRRSSSLRKDISNTYVAVMLVSIIFSSSSPGYKSLSWIETRVELSITRHCVSFIVSSSSSSTANQTVVLQHGVLMISTSMNLCGTHRQNRPRRAVGPKWTILSFAPRQMFSNFLELSRSSADDH